MVLSLTNEYGEDPTIGETGLTQLKPSLNPEVHPVTYPNTLVGMPGTPW